MKNIFAFAILFLSLTSFSQETTKKKFHTMGVTGGGAIAPPVLWGQINYGLEAVLLRKHEIKTPLTFYIHSKRIHMATWGLDLKGTYGGIGFFTGKKKVHIDFNAGLGYFEDRYNSEEEGIDSAVLPTGYLGFRLQSPNGWVSFRAGGGFPEIGSIGVGFHFL